MTTRGFVPLTIVQYLEPSCEFDTSYKFNMVRSWIGERITFTAMITREFVPFTIVQYLEPSCEFDTSYKLNMVRSWIQ
jgi:hypothetical protein